jgi:hypothetical protein
MDNNQNNLAILISQLPIDDAKKQELLAKLPAGEGEVRAEIKEMLENLAIRFGRMYRELDEAEQDFNAELENIASESEQLASGVSKDRTAQDLEKVRAQLAR